MKKLLMVVGVVLKLDPTPFSSKDRVLSESFLDWDKVLRSPTELFPLKKKTVILEHAFLFEYMAVGSFTIHKIY